MKLPVFIDYNSTTPVDERVVARMLPYFSERFGNSASRDHAFGWDAAEAVEEARGCVAELINAQPDEIIFTSGATEGISCALRGIMGLKKPRRLVTCPTEHESVLETYRVLDLAGVTETRLVPVDRFGHVENDVLAKHIDVEKAVVVLMFGNNEIGTIHPIRRFTEIAHLKGALFFSDIAQAVGKAAINVRVDGIDLAAFSAHKLYGPKGVGALFVRNGEPRFDLEPLIVGGSQERTLRSGTLNVPGIVGFGEACRIAKQEMKEEIARVRNLRDKLENVLLSELPDIWINGNKQDRLPNTSNIGFRGIEARTLIRDMHDIAVSTRSACSSGSAGPSHVLKAIGLTDDEAYSCIRFSLGRFTTDEEIDYAIEKVISSVARLRKHAATFVG
jgi:cysteine desulfurase